MLIEFILFMPFSQVFRKMQVVAKWWVRDYKSPPFIYGFMGDSMQTIQIPMKI